MTVIEKQQSPETKAQEEAVRAESEAEFVSKIAESMSLPESLAKAVDRRETQEKQETSNQPEDESNTVQDKVEEDNGKFDEETSENEDGAKNSTEDSEDDLIPKSRVQKRIDELTREKFELEARLRKLEEAQEQASPKDPDIERLEKMSDSELTALKREVRLAQIESAQDKAKLGKLFELEEKIETVSRTAPERFQFGQVKQFNEAVAQSSRSIENFEKVKQEIFGYAKSIFEATPEFKSSVSGQARAWNLAVQHFNLMNAVAKSKESSLESERKLNTLKKKVSVDSTSSKVSSSPSSELDKLFKKARNGGVDDKTEFFRRRLDTDSMIPEQFRSKG